MKKLLIIITLFVSSFFLFSGDVKAYDLSYDVDLDFSLIKEEFFTFKSLLDEYLKNNSTYTGKYIIRWTSNRGYFALVQKENSSYYFSLSSTVIRFNYDKFDRLQLNSSNSIYVNYVDSSSYSDIITGSTFNPHLFSNLNLTTSNSFVINYNYEDFIYTDSSDTNNKISSLYDIYLEYQNYLGNKDLIHKEELETIESFYSVIIEKLGYLAESIVSNYIYLSIIAIFILIFVFMLIFRRFL